MTDASKKADLLEKHQCQANYSGSAPSMETESVKRIFTRSEETRKLQYTEYFGDGDCKAYNEVENAYDNVHVEKKGMCRSRSKAGWDSVKKTEERQQGNWWKLKTDRLFNRQLNFKITMALRLGVIVVT